MGFEASGAHRNPEVNKNPFYLSELEAKLHGVEGQYQQEACLSHIERYRQIDKQIGQIVPVMNSFLHFWEHRPPGQGRLASQIHKHTESREYVQQLLGNPEHPYRCPASGEELDYSQDQPSQERLKERLAFILSYLPEAALDRYRVQCYEEIIKEVNPDNKPGRLMLLKNVHTRKYIAWANELAQLLAEFGYHPHVQECAKRLWDIFDNELQYIYSELSINQGLIEFPTHRNINPNPDDMFAYSKAGILAQASVIHLISEKGPVALSVNPNTDLFGAADLVVFDGESGVDQRVILVQVKKTASNQMKNQINIEDLSLSRTTALTLDGSRAKLNQTALDYQDLTDAQVKPIWVEMGRFDKDLDNNTGCMLTSGNKNGIPEFHKNRFYQAASKDIANWIDWLIEEEI